MSMAREAEQESGYEGSDGLDVDDLEAVVNAVYSDQFLNLKSVLDQQQVVAVATAAAFADEYDVPLIKGMIRLFLQLKVSERARGRTDMRSVLQSFLGRNPQDEMKDFERSMR